MENFFFLLRSKRIINGKLFSSFPHHANTEQRINERREYSYLCRERFFSSWTILNYLAHPQKYIGTIIILGLFLIDQNIFFLLIARAKI